MDSYSCPLVHVVKRTLTGTRVESNPFGRLTLLHRGENTGQRSRTPENIAFQRGLRQIAAPTGP